MRAPTIMLVACVMVLCAAVSSADTTFNRRVLATGDGDTVANRNRLYQSVAAHKQPVAPRSPAKAFERRRTTGKHLLEAPVANAARELLATGDGDTVANRNRLYQSVAAHKQPVAPRSPAKAFERRRTTGKL